MSAPLSQPPFLQRPTVLGLLLFGLTLLAFAPGFNGDFIWDDDITITNNPMVKLPLGEGLAYIWFSTHPTDYYPLTWSSFWLEWRLWGANPAGYHAVNIILHALSAIIFWRILTVLRVPGAWIAAFLFAVHPICVDSVVWISQRKNTLSMLFYALTLLAYLRFDESGKRSLLWLSLISFAAALLSKTSIIGTPVVILCLLWFKHGRVPLRSASKLAPFFLLAAGAAFMTLWFQGKVLGYGADSGNAAGATILKELTSINSEEINVLERILLVGHVYWFYFLKILLPQGISMVYHTWQVSASRPAAWLPTPLLAAALAATFHFHKKIGRGPFAALAYLVAALFPVLGIFSMSYHHYSWVANHLGYVAVPGVVALATGLAASAFSKAGDSLPRAAPAVVAGLVAVGLAWSTWNRAGLYIDPVNLWKDTIAKSPRATAGFNELGIVYINRQQYPEAKDALVKAIELDPRFAKPHNNLGTVYSYTGENELAIEEFKKAIELNPLDADATGNLGLLYFRTGKPEKALECYHRALEFRLMSPTTYFNMGLTYRSLGRAQEAFDAYARAVEMAPQNAVFHSEFGSFLYSQKQFPRALHHHLIAIQLDPDRVNSTNAAAWILATNADARLRDGQRALQLVEHTQSILGEKKPPSHLITRAAVLAELGRFQEAVAVVAEVIRHAEATGDQALLERARIDLAIYQSQKPYREGGAP